MMTTSAFLNSSQMMTPEQLTLAADRLQRIAHEIAECEGYFVAMKLEGAADLMRITAQGRISPGGAQRSHQIARALLGLADGERMP
jgi:hypothetical protein